MVSCDSTPLHTEAQLTGPPLSLSGWLISALVPGALQVRGEGRKQALVKNVETTVQECSGVRHTCARTLSHSRALLIHTF